MSDEQQSLLMPTFRLMGPVPRNLDNLELGGSSPGYSPSSPQYHPGPEAPSARTPPQQPARAPREPTPVSIHSSSGEESAPEREASPPPPPQRCLYFYVSWISLQFFIILGPYFTLLLAQNFFFPIYFRPLGGGFKSVTASAKEYLEETLPAKREKDLETLQRTYLPSIKNGIRIAQRKQNLKISLMHKVTKKNFIVVLTGVGLHIRAHCKDGLEVKTKVLEPLINFRHAHVPGGYTHWW